LFSFSATVNASVANHCSLGPRCREHQNASLLEFTLHLPRRGTVKEHDHLNTSRYFIHKYPHLAFLLFKPAARNKDATVDRNKADTPNRFSMFPVRHCWCSRRPNFPPLLEAMAWAFVQKRLIVQLLKLVKGSLRPRELSNSLCFISLARIGASN
jgi:hypothetical protein